MEPAVSSGYSSMNKKDSLATELGSQDTNETPASCLRAWNRFGFRWKRFATIAYAP